MYQLFRKVAQSFGDKVRIAEIDLTPKTLQKQGTTEPLINGKIKLLGPASERDVQKTTQEEIEKFGK
jgi:hypothetical protein